VNQAGCERVFSDLKVKQTQRRNRLKLEKLGKMTKVLSIESSIHSSNPDMRGSRLVLKLERIRLNVESSS
jgi:hypothetical protein